MKYLPWYLDLYNEAWEYPVGGKIPWITIDFETTNLDKGDSRNAKNRIVKVAFHSSDDPGFVLTGDAAWEMIRYYNGKPAILVAHNAKFELAWLNREGFDTSLWLPWDTMIAEFVRAGNRKWDLSLDATAQRYRLGSKGRVIDRMMKAGVCPSEMPEHLLHERVVWDVDKTYKLALEQRRVLEEEGLLKVMFTRCILTPVLAEIETYGMSLDKPKVIETYDEAITRRLERNTELVAMAEGRKLRGPQLADLLYNVLGFKEATDYRGNVIKTDTGRPVTDSDTIMGLEAKTPNQKRFKEIFKEYNKIDSAISKNLEFFYRVVTEGGGSFVANFNQTIAQTHRLTSTGKPTVFSDGKKRSVQFQNLPREYRHLFRGRDGYLIFDADGAQLEFRVGGSLSRDPQVYEDAINNADIHRYTASVLLRKPESEVTKEERQAGKPFTFKPMYGGNSGTARQKAYFAAFREKYKVMFETQTGWTMEVLRTGKLVTATGLTFYWPGTKMHRSGYVDNTPSIFDYPIQSLATADIIPISVVYTFWTLKAEGVDARIVNTVHDNIAVEVRPEGLDKLQEIVVHCFLDRTYEYMERVYGIDLYVPLGVAYRAGEFWGDGDEVKVSYKPSPNKGE